VVIKAASESQIMDDLKKLESRIQVKLLAGE
jgi:hypothetical protein